MRSWVQGYAGAGFAAYEHRGVDVGEKADAAERIHQLGRLADEPFAVPAPGHAHIIVGHMLHLCRVEIARCSLPGGVRISAFEGQGAIGV